MRIRRPLPKAYRDAMAQINLAYPEGVPSILNLKRDVSIEAIVASPGGLDTEPDTVRGESRWCCPFHDDTNPSLWARDDHNGTGIGRWGCNPCGISGDVYDFLIKLHGFTKTEAYRWVKSWRDRHRPGRKMRVHLRRSL